jgi:hypothetical protein
MSIAWGSACAVREASRLVVHRVDLLFSDNINEAGPTCKQRQQEKQARGGGHQAIYLDSPMTSICGKLPPVASAVSPA